MFVTSAMNVMVAAAVFVTLLCCGALGSSLDTALSDDVASLLDRMKAQESLNRELTTKLLRHEDRLSQQENLNRELRTRLTRQNETLLQQGRLIQQLRSVVAASRASAAVNRTSATVNRASAWVDTAPTFRHVNVVDVMDAPDPETPDSRADSAVSGRIVAQRSYYIGNVAKKSAAGQNGAKQSDSAHNVAKQSAAGQNVAKQPAAGQNVAKQPDSAHNVVKRSDDGGPLEAVVNQISQRVTEMGAELLALKTQTTADVQTLRNSDRQQDQNIHDARTSTFVRWGSSSCGDSSSLVYSGIVGGSYYQDAGAATDYLCLTLSPVPSQRAPPPEFARLFGAEYQTHDSYEQKDPLCAVCRAAFSTTVMVPGTDTCSPGWHRHYSGFLMAGSYDQSAGTQYICVDPAMESAPNGDANENGKLLYFTVSHCGSLPCGPYVNNKVVTCAVCSM